MNNKIRNMSEIDNMKNTILIGRGTKKEIKEKGLMNTCIYVSIFDEY